MNQIEGRVLSLSLQPVTGVREGPDASAGGTGGDNDKEQHPYLV